MKDNGKTLQIYWDNFRLWKDKQPDVYSTSDEKPIGQYVPGLLWNFPNPFSEGTRIGFNLNEPEKFRLLISDIHGRSIRIFEGESSILNNQ